MVSLRCNDYGYECNYVSEGEVDKVVEEYKQHMDEEHGIDYSKEAIMDFVNFPLCYIITLISIVITS